jgi:thymidylate synthase (FAD)
MDKWKHLRKNLFRAIEPEIKLVAITQPVDEYKNLCHSNTLPAFTARVSHESKGTIEDDLRLNKLLIKLGHDTPLQAVEFVFCVSGITKSLQAQWTRHKIGVGWTFRSTRYISANQNCFVYNAYDYIDDEKKVKELLKIEENVALQAIDLFNQEIALGATKEDARKIMPVFWATSCYFYTNARALRHLFKLRLSGKAEWEIRRMAAMMFDVCMRFTPSLFEDFKELRAEIKY